MGVTWRWDKTPAERRSAARRQPTLGTICRLAAADGSDLGSALVWNLSLRGVSLLLGQRLEPGTVVTAELVNEAGVAVRRGMRVAHAAKLQTGDFALGGQFDQELTPDEMSRFVA